MVKAVKKRGKDDETGDLQFDDPNVAVFEKIAARLDREQAKTGRKWYHPEKPDDPMTAAMTAALELAAFGDLEWLKRLLVDKTGEENVALFIHYPKGERGKRTRQMLLRKLGIKGDTRQRRLILLAAATERRIRQLFKTDYPLRLRRREGITWSPAQFAARYWSLKTEGKVDAPLVRALERGIQNLARKGSRKAPR
jgi:hypothetical protein